MDGARVSRRGFIQGVTVGASSLAAGSALADEPAAETAPVGGHEILAARVAQIDRKLKHIGEKREQFAKYVETLPQDAPERQAAEQELAINSVIEIAELLNEKARLLQIVVAAPPQRARVPAESRGRAYKSAGGRESGASRLRELVPEEVKAEASEIVANVRDALPENQALGCFPSGCVTCVHCPTSCVGPCTNCVHCVPNGVLN